jgi:hypothetical protein
MSEGVRIKLSESILRTKTLSGKDVAWKKYAQHLRGLSFHVDECQKDVQEIRIAILVSEASTFRIQVLREK